MNHEDVHTKIAIVPCKGMEQRPRLRLLVVEDEPELRSTLAEALVEEGYQVETAATATEGLAQLRAGQFQLVISDYRLPDETGGWMLRCAAAEGILLTTRVLVITGELMPEDVSNLRVLRKPLSLELFIREIELLLRVPG